MDMRGTHRSVVSLTLMGLLCASALGYSGGSGTPQDPYQIATAVDLIALGRTLADYDKCFILTASIDLDPNLPGGKVFDRAVIAPDTDDAHLLFQGTPFSGLLDGDGHVIRNLRIVSNHDCLGLFGQLAGGAKVSTLGLENATIEGAGNVIGGLVGLNHGLVLACFTTGTVQGASVVGGLAGRNGELSGDGVDAQIAECYSTCAVVGTIYLGGLVGFNAAHLSNCYSTGNVTGSGFLGGLAGVTIDIGLVSRCFWDTQTSHQAASDGGTGLPTVLMQDISTFQDAGWKIYAAGTSLPQDAVWTIKANYYPRLAWQRAFESTVDGFETRDFSVLTWWHQGKPWQVTSGQAFSGKYSARSGAIGDQEVSALVYERDCQAGQISFSVKVSSEPTNDKLLFRMDGQQTATWSGEQPWIKVSYPVSKGTHTFEWSYEKSTSKAVGEDAAWIDDVNVPGMQAPADQTGIVFVSIPAGTFQMGDHDGVGYSDERPVHAVTLTGFQMGKYEVTNAQYAAYLNAVLAAGQIRVVGGVVYASWDSSRGQPYFDTVTSYPYSQIDYYGQGQFMVRSRDCKSMSDHPVVCVTWYGAKAFCDYYGYRLPTEAEWEYAASGGYHDPYYRYPWGSSTIDCTKANYYNGSSFCNPWNLTSFPYTSPVGYYGPQGAYGLCDMSGNAWEWCQDWYGSGYYSVSPASNPSGPATGTFRVLRGGSWCSIGSYCRVSYRYCGSPDYRSHDVGFRVCR